MYEEKIKFYQSQIEATVGKKNILNATEVQKCINMSSSTFSRKVKANDLKDIPEFTVTEYKRNGKPYSTYKFDVFSVVRFLANKG